MSSSTIDVVVYNSLYSSSDEERESAKWKSYMDYQNLPHNDKIQT